MIVYQIYTAWREVNQAPDKQSSLVDMLRLLSKEDQPEDQEPYRFLMKPVQSKCNGKITHT